MLFVPKKKRIESEIRLRDEALEELRQRNAKTLKELREADQHKNSKKITKNPN